MAEREVPEKRRRGRPPNPVKRVQVWLRATQEEQEAWEHAAWQRGLSLSAWIRMTCNSKVRGLP